MTLYLDLWLVVFITREGCIILSESREIFFYNFIINLYSAIHTVFSAPECLYFLIFVFVFSHAYRMSSVFLVHFPRRDRLYIINVCIC